jgi:thiol:disulfide interchange protein
VLIAMALAGCDSAPVTASSDGGLARAGEGVAAAPAEAAPPARAPSTEGWNDAQIAWQPYEAGLARAKAEHKPICLVVHTSWCPHCKTYSHVFEDPRIVRRARDFVMIRVDGDRESAVAEKYAPDGGYIPRTFFLSPDGKPDFELHAPRDRFRFFFDEHDPKSLLAGLDAAFAKLSR